MARLQVMSQFQCDRCGIDRGTNTACRLQLSHLATSLLRLRRRACHDARRIDGAGSLVRRESNQLVLLIERDGKVLEENRRGIANPEIAAEYSPALTLRRATTSGRASRPPAGVAHLTST